MQIHRPLAVRSSSSLEDAIKEPFANVFSTKMIPNNQHEPDTRFKKLTEAVKFVFASTSFRCAKAYLKSARKSITDEKLAVIVQEVVGSRLGSRFYPHISGVARTYNFYPSGQSKPEDGVTNLALGLGKTVVEWRRRSGGIREFARQRADGLSDAHRISQIGKIRCTKDARDMQGTVSDKQEDCGRRA